MADRSASRPLFYFNAALTTLVIVLLMQGLFADSLGLPELPAPLIFMVAFAIALPIDRRTATANAMKWPRTRGHTVLVRFDDSGRGRLWQEL